MSVPFVSINGVLTLVIGGNSVQVGPEHPSYGTIKKVLKTATEAELLKLVDVKTAVQTYVSTASNGRAEVKDGQVYFDGKPVHNTLAKRVIDFMKEGLPFEHLLRFMENVSANPSYTAQNELFDFLENKNLPITEDGCFLAYKAIRHDWMDKYTGTVDNHIGKKPSMKRSQVDDNRKNECSKGLHCGALDYVAHYGGGDDRIIIVKVNPKDAVSVPCDYSFQKLRCSDYEVMAEFTGELVKPLYKDDVNPVASPVDDDNYDWSWCDDDDDYDDDWDEDDYDDDDYEDDDDECDCDECCGDYHPDDVIVTTDRCDCGYKPDGKRYHNVRDEFGRFTSK